MLVESKPNDNTYNFIHDITNWRIKLETFFFKENMTGTTICQMKIVIKFVELH